MKIFMILLNKKSTLLIGILDNINEYKGKWLLNYFKLSIRFKNGNIWVSFRDIVVKFLRFVSVVQGS